MMLQPWHLDPESMQGPPQGHKLNDQPTKALLVSLYSVKQKMHERILKEDEEWYATQIYKC